MAFRRGRLAAAAEAVKKAYEPAHEAEGLPPPGRVEGARNGIKWGFVPRGNGGAGDQGDPNQPRAGD